MSAARPISETLTPHDVAADLKVSLNTARKIMRENRPFYVGKCLRWTRTQLERYKRAGGSPRCEDEKRSPIDSTSEDPRGGSGDTTTPESDGSSPRARQSAAPRLRLLAKSKGAELFPPIVPRTSSRSSKR